MKYVPLLLNSVTATLSVVALSCLVSTMALFMGAGQEAIDLQSLVYLQIASIPIALIAVLMSRFAPGPGVGNKPTFKKLYMAIPQWMIFCFIVLNLLVAFGEVALMVVARTMPEDLPWTNHAPLVSMFVCSLAVCVVHGRAQLIAGRPVAFSGRWAP